MLSSTPATRGGRIDGYRVAGPPGPARSGPFDLVAPLGTPPRCSMLAAGARHPLPRLVLRLGPSYGPAPPPCRVRAFVECACLGAGQDPQVGVHESVLLPETWRRSRHRLCKECRCDHTTGIRQVVRTPLATSTGMHSSPVFSYLLASPERKTGFFAGDPAI